MASTSKFEFLYYLGEREHIRLRKEDGQPKPWTQDYVFQTTYFCNNNREDDRVTRWIRTNYNLHPDAATMPMMVARFVNKPETLKDLGWPWLSFHPTRWKDVMSKPGAWGSAYIVSTNGNPMPKHEYIAGLLEQAWARFGLGGSATLPGTLAGAHAAIQGAPGMGSFMAAQVVADLKNTEGHALANADDWFTFAAHGPGSLRGLSWFHNEKITPSKFTDALASARQWVYNNGRSGLIEHLCNQNLQNCFCEFDKYMRVKTNTGRSKRKYAGI